MVLAHSLKDNGTEKRLAVLVTLDTLAASTVEELKVCLVLSLGKTYIADGYG
jgi:hypothetical protein